LVLVTVRENEPFEKALRRFRRKVEREGIRKDIKKNSFYLKPGEKRRLKQRLAEKRRRKAARRAMRKPPVQTKAGANDKGGTPGTPPPSAV
jgi:small subunit ribosomal protein S21